MTQYSGEPAHRSGRGPGSTNGRTARRPAVTVPTGGRDEQVGARWLGRQPVEGRPRNFLVARWRWIVVVTLAVVAAAAAFSWSHTPTYRSSADVLVQPRVFAVGTAPQVPDMGSEQALAKSTTVLDIAAKALRVPVAELRTGLSVAVPLNTHVLRIAYVSSSPAEAQQRAQAVATAFVRYWIAQQPPLRGAGGSQDFLKAAVISDAQRPGAPSSPKHNVDIAIAVLIGLALGIGTAYLRDRLDDRLRGAPDLELLGGAPVVGLIPPARRWLTGRAPVLREADSPGAVAYSDLARHLLRVAANRSARTVLITSPVGDAQTGVSTNLAVALAEAGHTVVLVHADLREAHSPGAFGLDPERSLAAVIAGRIGLTDAVHNTAITGLHVIPAGRVEGNVGAALHSPELRQTMRRLRTTADVVVIDAPPALAGPDLTSLADLADLVLLVGDSRRTTRRQIQAAARQLEPVRSKIIGSVLENFRAALHGPVGGRPSRPRGHLRPHDLGEPPSTTPPDAIPAANHANGWGDPATTAKR
jgi:succinoglycan biosynthesis transport protein ExoP